MIRKMESVVVQKRLGWIDHAHRDGEPFRGCVDPDNLKSVVQ